MPVAVRQEQRLHGVGVIDTSALYGASSHLGFRTVWQSNGGIFEHPSRVLMSTNEDYFASLLHSLLLYDELRTDLSILDEEMHFYREPVETLTAIIGKSMPVRPMPETIPDSIVMHSLAPAFIQRIEVDIRKKAASAALGQIPSVVQALAYPDTHDAPVTTVHPDVLWELATRITAEGIYHGTADHVVQALGRQLSILARTMKYSAHCGDIQRQDGVAAAFCAAPRRIEILRDYLDHERMQEFEFAQSGFTDLLSSLGLPETGYDFSMFAPKLNVVQLTSLSLFVADFSPQEALERVLNLRETDGGRELRRLWAERLWARGNQAVEGFGLSMSNINAGRDVIQMVIGNPHGGWLAKQALDSSDEGLLADLRNWLNDRLSSPKN